MMTYTHVPAKLEMRHAHTHAIHYPYTWYKLPGRLHQQPTTYGPSLLALGQKSRRPYLTYLRF